MCRSSATIGGGLFQFGFDYEGWGCGWRGRWWMGWEWGSGLSVVLKEGVAGMGAVRRLVVDGAWCRDSWRGVAAAWCLLDGEGRVRESGKKDVFVSLALMTEALAVWHSLVWAVDRGWDAVEVLFDCLLLVQGLKNMVNAKGLFTIMNKEGHFSYSSFFTICSSL